MNDSILTTTLRAIITVPLLLGLGSCTDSRPVETLDCGAGEPQTYGEDAVCLFSREIIEDGFRCPVQRPHAQEYEDFVACTEEREPPGGLVDQFGEPEPLEQRASCETDADCRDQAPATVCGNAGRCVLPDECRNSDCLDLGPNMVCGAAGTCVEATSEQCTHIAGPIDRDNVFLVGMLYAGAEFSSTGTSQLKAATMAVDDFNGRVPFSPIDRRAVLIGCDDRGNPEDGVATARHLVDELGVQAIIGPGFSSTYIEVVGAVTADAGVFTISPSATSTAITGLPDDDLAWRTVPSDVHQAAAMVRRIRELQDVEGTGLDVLVLRKEDAYGRGLAENVSDGLAGESFETVVVSLGDGRLSGASAEAARSGMQQMPNPDVVLLLGTPETWDALETIVTEYEVTPTYILSDGGRLPDLGAVVMSLGDSSLFGRVEGTSVALENDEMNLYASFAARYRAAHQEEPTRFASSAYDAMTLILYSRIALDAEGLPFTGANIADVFQTQFTTADAGVITASPSDIANGRDILAAGGSFNFEGASGPLDFDPDTGEAPSLVDRWVVSEEGEIVDCGRYHPTSDEWDMEAGCP